MSIRLLLCCAAVALAGCVETSQSRLVPDPDQSPAPWTGTEAAGSDRDIRFVVMTDRTGGMRPGVWAAACDKVNLLRPQFVMCVGDLVPGYTEDEAEIRDDWVAFDRIAARIEAPFFYTPGNHDQSNDVMRRVWAERYGPSYYHFVYRDALFIVLNSEDGGTHRVSPAQVAWLDRVLADHPDVRWTLLFIHAPLWYEWEKPQANGWAAMEPLLAGRPHSVFCGHYHRYEHSQRHGADYYMLGTLGGETPGRNPAEGSLDHLTLVTLTDAGPTVALIEPDNIWDSDLVTPETTEWQRTLVNAPAVTVEPLFSDGPTFSRLHAKLTLTNPTEAPLAFALACQAPRILEIDAPTDALTLAAGESQDVPFDLTVETGESGLAEAMVNGVGPVTLRWTAEQTLPSGRHAMIEQTQPMRVVGLLPCPRASRAIVVDGDLDEWGELPHRCRKPAEIHLDPATHAGPDDCSYALDVRWDERFLYVAVAVRDDVVFRSESATRPWHQDGVEIRLDARPDPLRSNGRGVFARRHDDYAMIGLSPATADQPLFRFEPKRWPAGTRAACVQTDDGWAAEVAIPVEALDAWQQQTWRRVRLSVAVDDFDGQTNAYGRPIGAQLMWHEAWWQDGNVPGSGTFRR